MIFYYKHVFDFVSQFETPKSGFLKKANSKLNNVSANLSLHKGQFILQFSTQAGPDRVKVGDIFKKVSFDAPQPLVFHNFFINNTSFSTDWMMPDHTAGLGRFWSKGLSFEKSYFYRLVIPVEITVDIFFKVQDVNHETDFNYSRMGTSVTIDDVVYAVHYIEDKSTDRGFLIVNSSSRQNLNVFRDKAFSLQIGLGYILGHFVGGRGYYLAYSNAQMDNITHFLHAQLRRSLRSSYHPIYANAHGYIVNHKSAELVHKKLKPLSLPEFSRLCQKINSSLDFASVCLSVIEAGTASLFPMACGYAVVLESLSKIILAEQEEQNGSMAPITDKKLAKTLVVELMKTLNQICPSPPLPEDSFTPLKVRIENVNQKTNMNSLKAPFELYGVKLTDEDIRVLKTRNDFLHGRVPLLDRKDDKNDIEGLNKDLFYAAVRLYTLVNIQILKYKCLSLISLG